MKRAKMVLLLALAFGIASAFTTQKKSLNTYIAVYDTETSFHWELLQGDFGGCEGSEEKACSVQAESLPDANDKPSGYIPGEYQP